MCHNKTVITQDRWGSHWVPLGGYIENKVGDPNCRAVASTPIRLMVNKVRLLLNHAGLLYIFYNI
jgi:hypothetical protein